MVKALPTCPICEKPLPDARTNSAKPFCSKRCKDIDLNRWLSGGYFIPGNQSDDESEAVPSGETQENRANTASNPVEKTKH